MTKSILCFGDSNVWGAIPGAFNPETGLSGRRIKAKRWTGILQSNLGAAYNVIEDGISARTTNLDEIVPGRPYKNGFTQLPVSLETHYPIDLVLLWLGTNDVKVQYNRSADDIVKAMRSLAEFVLSSNKGCHGNAPKVMIVAAPAAIEATNPHPQYNEASLQKTRMLAGLYQQLAADLGCEFFDAGSVATASIVDGVHLDDPACEAIGKALADKIKQMEL